MGIIIEPTLKPNVIEVPISDEVTEVAEVGRSFPIVEINNVLIPQQQITRLKIDVSLYSIPTFNLTVVDVGEKIIKTLSNTKYDKITIFLGHKDIHIKFDGIVTSVTGTNSIRIAGVMGVNEFFDTEQKLYKEKTVTDILKEFCEKTKFGLFTFENQKLQEPIDIIINPNRRRLDFVSWLIKTYTTCLFSYDTFGYLHVGDVETMLNQPIDKYKFDVIHGDKFKEEKELIFSNDDNHELPNDNKERIQIESYSIQTNFGYTLLKAYKNLTVDTEKEKLGTETDEEIGSGDKPLNTWSGFQKHKNVEYYDSINKILLGNFISLTLKNPCYEIVPFSVVGVELFQHIDNVQKDEITDNQKALDKEHSGKHLVVGYSYSYDSQPRDEKNNVQQTIELI